MCNNHIVLKHTVSCGEDGRTRSSLPSPTDNRYNTNNKPLEVTRINQDPKTGQLIMQKEQIKSKVFQTSWQQPTMMLAGYGDREVNAAMQRSHDQNTTEKEVLKEPRRHEQFIKDALEDDDN